MEKGILAYVVRLALIRPGTEESEIIDPGGPGTHFQIGKPAAGNIQEHQHQQPESIAKRQGRLRPAQAVPQAGSSVYEGNVYQIKEQGNPAKQGEGAMR